jgi:hypothetical protein
MSTHADEKCTACGAYWDFRKRPRFQKGKSKVYPPTTAAGSAGNSSSSKAAQETSPGMPMGDVGASGPTAQEAGTKTKKKKKKPAPEGTSSGATGSSAQPKKTEDQEEAVDGDPNSFLSLQEQILRVQAHIKTKEKKIASTKDRIAQQQAALERAQRLIQEETERLAKHEMLKENSTRVLTGLRLRVMAADGAHALVQAAKTFKDLCQTSTTDTAEASVSAQLVACLRPLSRVWADMCDAELDVPIELDDPKGERAAAAAARAASEAAAAAEAAKASATLSRASEVDADEDPTTTKGDDQEPLEAAVAALIAEEAVQVAADNQARYVAEARAAAEMGISPPTPPTDKGTAEEESAPNPGTPQAEAMEVDETLRGRPRAPSGEEAEAAPPSTKRLCAGNPAATPATDATGGSSSSAGEAAPKAAAVGPPPLPLPPDKPAGAAAAGTNSASAAAKVVAKATSRAKSKQ